MENRLGGSILSDSIARKCWSIEFNVCLASLARLPFPASIVHVEFFRRAAFLLLQRGRFFFAPKDLPGAVSDRSANQRPWRQLEFT
jgi:hypothetical protein